MPQFLRYLCAGLACAGLEYGAFLLLHHKGNWGLLSANTLAYSAGLLGSFALNKWWVFGGQQQYQTPQQFLAYCALALFNYGLGSALLWMLVQHAAWGAWLAKGFAMASIVLWNFFIYKKVIYR